jgi:transposase
MIGSTRMVRVFVYGAATDMRLGFDGLYGLVLGAFRKPPLSGDVFLFIGKDRRRAKALHWDGTGLCLYSKRLEKGRFAPLHRTDSRRRELTLSELSLFFEGSREIGRKTLSPPEFRHNFVE